MLMPTLFGAAVAGTYALAQRVVLQPVYLVNYSVQTVFLAVAARTLREDPASLRARFLDTSAILALLLIPAAAVAPFAPTLFALCFGEAWRESGVWAGILIFPAITYIVATSTNCLHVCGYNKWEMFIEGGYLLLCATLLAAAWRFHLSPVTTVCCVAATAVLAHATLWSTNALLPRRGIDAAVLALPR